MFTIYISKVGWCGRGQAARQLPDLQLSSSSFDVVSDKEIPAGFPQIIQNPGMKVVEKGRNTVLVCEAGGDPNPTITWIKVGWRYRINLRSSGAVLYRVDAVVMGS